ncbi:MAG: superoxide dismutase [Alphaproteobacteria bacterium]
MAGPFELPALPYADDALSPVISAQTVGLHHGKHHATYFNNLNNLAAGTELEGMSLEQVVVKSAGDDSMKGVFNNAGQAWNHIIYWEQFGLNGSRAPEGDLKAQIEAGWESFDGFKDAFTKAAAGVFGAGWCWLVADQGKLSIMGTSNADNPLAHGKQALLGIDVWEHAYYLDYQNRRPDHVKALLDQAINWSYVAERLSAA